MSAPWAVVIDLTIIGLANGLIVALIALGYTMVYGIIELINFAHGDLFMLGCFCALTVVGLGQDLGLTNPWALCLVMALVVPAFCAGLNLLADRIVFRPLREAPKLSALVSAIGTSFVFINIGLFWSGLPMAVFSGGHGASSQRGFPDLIGSANLFGAGSPIHCGFKDVMVVMVTIPLLLGLTWLVRSTRLGRSMRAAAQDPIAARLMGIDVDRVISQTFLLGGALAGVASVVYSLYHTTIHFEMGFQAGLDAFTAAVLGGIGNFTGAVLGGVIIGLVRAFSDFYLHNEWTNVVVFSVLILLLVFRPTGLLGTRIREKV